MRTLVLSESFQPIHEISWQRAITYWFLEKVDIIEYYDQEVHSSTQSFRVPAVVRFYSSGRARRSEEIRYSRNNLWLRDEKRCQYCMVQVDKDKFTVDHVVPRSRGGKTTWQNSVVACMPCNTKKRDMSPDEAGLKLNKKPRQPLGLTCKSYFLYNPSMPKEWEAWLISK